MSAEKIAHHTEPAVIVDHEAGERYNFVASKGREMFHGSALVDATAEVTQADLDLIRQFHLEVAPTNPSHPWRVSKLTDEEKEKLPPNQINDPSTFGNWEAPGGPLEHIELASDSAMIVVDLLKHHFKTADSEEVQRLQQEISQINPYLAAAVAALHDEGREVTHRFYTNELIGDQLLRKMGIREDMIQAMPDEKVMQVAVNEDMDEMINSLTPLQVIIRIVDEFGKRAPKTNRLYQPSDYTSADRDAWAKQYAVETKLETLMQGPGGVDRKTNIRPSDAWMQKQMNLHKYNVTRYFEALDRWVQRSTDLSLEDIAQTLNQELAPRLEPLPTP